jgi:hypothetical protein
MINFVLLLLGIVVAIILLIVFCGLAIYFILPPISIPEFTEPQIQPGTPTSTVEVKAYENPNYDKLLAVYKIGSYNKVTEDIDNKISSLRIPLGLSVKVYDSHDYVNELGTFTEDVPTLSEDVENKISSIKVSKI